LPDSEIAGIAGATEKDITGKGNHAKICKVKGIS